MTITAADFRILDRVLAATPAGGTGFVAYVNADGGLQVRWDDGSGSTVTPREVSLIARWHEGTALIPIRVVSESYEREGYAAIGSRKGTLVVESNGVQHTMSGYGHSDRDARSTILWRLSEHYHQRYGRIDWPVEPAVVQIPDDGEEHHCVACGEHAYRVWDCDGWRAPAVTDDEGRMVDACHGCDAGLVVAEAS